VKRLSEAGRLALVAAVLAGLGVAGVGVTDAAFFSTSSNPSSSFSSAPDWVAPSSSRQVAGKATGCAPSTTGFVKPGGSYHVYAEVADTGNPASGTTSATTDVGAITAGETAAALTAGSYTAGTSYNYRSAALTAGSSLSEGTKTYSLGLADGAGNTRTETGYTVTIDGTTPAAADVQATNDSGSVSGRPDQGDKITFTFSEQIEACSVLADWNGGGTSVTVKIIDSGASDALEIWNGANTARLPLGSVDLKGDTAPSGDALFTSSTMEQTGASIIVALGTLSGSVETTSTTTAIVWTPSTTPYDRAHNASSDAAATESGAADLDF
jgi:hypothetical protein